jgi:hypothetical protein
MIAMPPSYARFQTMKKLLPVAARFQRAECRPEPDKMQSCCHENLCRPGGA